MLKKEEQKFRGRILNVVEKKRQSCDQGFKTRTIYFLASFLINRLSSFAVQLGWLQPKSFTDCHG